MAVKVFLCYAREDEELVKLLKRHLRPLQRAGLIDVWYDRDISGGEDWEKEINTHLEASEIILLLVSAAFIDSDYCWGIEMKKAMERHSKGNAHVVPIILRHTYWQTAPFGKLQAYPKDAIPVTDRRWHTLDEAFFDITGEIRKLIETIESLAASTVIIRAQESNTEDRTPIPNNRDRFDDFNEEVRKVLTLAKEEAQRRQHNYIDTEHLLLGLVRQGESVAAKILTNLGVEPNKVRSAVEFLIAGSGRIFPDEVLLTLRAKKVIELTVDEANRLNHHNIGTEHLLLGLVREGEGIAAGVLESLGVSLEKARTQTVKIVDMGVKEI